MFASYDVCWFGVIAVYMVAAVVIVESGLVDNQDQTEPGWPSWARR